jgi:integrase/recombinase XerD
VGEFGWPSGLATKRVSPHSLRHSTATHLLCSSAEINIVRARLRHASLDTTNVYAQIDLEGKALALALAKCDVTNERAPKKRWVANPDLIPPGWVMKEYQSHGNMRGATGSG